MQCTPVCADGAIRAFAEFVHLQTQIKYQSIARWIPYYRARYGQLRSLCLADPENQSLQLCMCVGRWAEAPYFFPFTWLTGLSCLSAATVDNFRSSRTRTISGSQDGVVRAVQGKERDYSSIGSLWMGSTHAINRAASCCIAQSQAAGCGSFKSIWLLQRIAQHDGMVAASTVMPSGNDFCLLFAKFQRFKNKTQNIVQDFFTPCCSMTWVRVFSRQSKTYRRADRRLEHQRAPTTCIRVDSV